MESMGEYCSNAPCKWLLDLGKGGGAHDTNAHNLFDGMPSQPEEDQRISELVPMNSTMNKEEKWLDEALGWILEKFEQMEAKSRCDEKIDRILEKLDEIEANKNKFFKEISAFIKATTADFNLISFSTPPTSPTPVPAKCSMVCPYSGNTCAMASASHNIKVPTLTNAMGLLVCSNHFSGTATPTCTKCLANCFDNDTDMNHAILDEPCASTTAAATMEIVVSEDKASSIVINLLTSPRLSMQGIQWLATKTTPILFRPRLHSHSCFTY
uniref:Uncharacterized protein n=1 Tax=Oryza punctata TaxID=4537 RepID=A0A0E0M7K3_ORYPU